MADRLKLILKRKIVRMVNIGLSLYLEKCYWEQKTCILPVFWVFLFLPCLDGQKNDIKQLVNVFFAIKSKFTNYLLFNVHTKVKARKIVFFSTAFKAKKNDFRLLESVMKFNVRVYKRTIIINNRRYKAC